MKNREMLIGLKKVESIFDKLFDKLIDVAQEIVKNVFDDYCTSIDGIIVGDKMVEVVYEYSCRGEYGHESVFVPIEWFDEGFDYYKAAYREMKRKEAEAEQKMLEAERKRKAAAKKAAAARKAKKEYETYLKLKQKYEADEESK